MIVSLLDEVDTGGVGGNFHESAEEEVEIAVTSQF
jgi:hypothetical protein